MVNKVKEIDSEYEVISEITNISKRGRYLKMKHLACGSISSRRYDKFMAGQRCKCSRRKSHDDYVHEVNEIHGKDEWIFISKYTKKDSPIKAVHKCGYENYFNRAEYLLNKNQLNVCKGCHPGTSRDRKSINFRIKNNKIPIILIEDYDKNNRKDYYKVKQITCGHEYDVHIDKLIRFTTNNERPTCPVCGKYSKKINTDRVRREIDDGTNNEYKLLSEYSGNTFEYLDVKHNTCGNIYKTTRTNFVNNNRRCPFCTSNSSSFETEVLDYIESIYDGKIIHNDRTILDGKEIDIYLPDLGLGIECDGLYWHSEQILVSNKYNMNDISRYHLNKTLDSKEKGIKLIHIFEDEWNNNKLVKSKLSHILNLNKSNKIYARKCKVYEIDTKTKNNFLERNHIQGKDNSSIRLGLFYDGDIVAVMTFGKLRRALGNINVEEGEYELIRYAGDIDKIVVGGFSKLFKYFVREYSPEYIKTFADLRWSSFDNNLYDLNGFELSHISNPNYWYMDNNYVKREHRFKYRKNNLENLLESFDKELTEYENMLNNNYDRIWDCGNLVYEWKSKG
jgi:hypothetical protein